MNIKNREGVFVKLSNYNKMLDEERDKCLNIFNKIYTGSKDIDHSFNKYFASIIFWDYDDWYQMLPFIGDIRYVRFRLLYQDILSEIMNRNLITKNCSIYVKECLSLWCKSVIPDEDSIISVYYDLISDRSLQDQVYLNNKIWITSCIYCNLKTRCMLGDTGLGSCSKLMRCNLETGIHLCGNHYKFIFDKKYNRLGLSDLFLLNDGRYVRNMYMLDIYSNRKGLYFGKSEYKETIDSRPFLLPGDIDLDESIDFDDESLT